MRFSNYSLRLLQSSDSTRFTFEQGCYDSICFACALASATYTNKPNFTLAYVEKCINDNINEHHSVRSRFDSMRFVASNLRLKLESRSTSWRVLSVSHQLVRTGPGAKSVFAIQEAFHTTRTSVFPLAVRCPRMSKTSQSGLTESPSESDMWRFVTFQHYNSGFRAGFDVQAHCWLMLRAASQGCTKLSDDYLSGADAHILANHHAPRKPLHAKRVTACAHTQWYLPPMMMPRH